MGLVFRAWGLGFRVYGRISGGLGSRGFGFRVQWRGLGLRVVVEASKRSETMVVLALGSIGGSSQSGFS